MLEAHSCPTLVTLWTVACQAPLFLGILQAGILEWVDTSYSRGWCYNWQIKKLFTTSHKWFGFIKSFWVQSEICSFIKVSCGLPCSSAVRNLPPVQETLVRGIREDPTCLEAVKSMCHSSWPCALEPKCWNYWSLWPQKPCSTAEEVTIPKSPCAPELESSPCSSQLEKSLGSNEETVQPKINNLKKTQKTVRAKIEMQISETHTHSCF